MSRFIDSYYQPMAAYVPGEQLDPAKYVKLNTNENPYPPSPEVSRALAGASDCLRLYSQIAAPGISAAIAERHGVPVSRVLVTNGSDETLAFAFQAFGERGLAFPDVSYGFYEVWARAYRKAARIIPLADDYTVNVSDYLAGEETVVLANPNAPTGIAQPLSEIRRIVEANPNRVVIVDEAYADFGGESAIPLVERYENLLVVRTFSKSHSLAGARLGYAVASDALIADLNKIKFMFNPYNVNQLSQIAGEAAMRDQAYFEETRDRVVETRENMTRSLRGMGFRVLPSRANFVFAAHKSIGGRDYLEALRARGVLVRHFDAPLTRDFVRVSVGTDAQTRAYLNATEAILHEIG